MTGNVTMLFLFLICFCLFVFVCLFLFVWVLFVVFAIVIWRYALVYRDKNKKKLSKIYDVFQNLLKLQYLYLSSYFGTQSQLWILRAISCVTNVQFKRNNK